MKSILSNASKLLDKGVEEGVFPGAIALVGNKDKIIFKHACGCRQLYPDKKSMNMDTMFDLASLTKVVATTPLVMLLIESGGISLYDEIGYYLPQFKCYEDLRIINLLTHTSGFKDFFPLYKLCKGLEDSLDFISKSKLQCKVGEKVIYSDNNFIILRSVIEKVLGEPFEDSCYKYIFKPLGMVHTCFNPKDKDNIAATELDNSTGVYLKGVVHDENARFFNGVSGHAGLFSTAVDLSKYCSIYLINDKKLLSESSINCINHNYTKSLGESRGLGFCVKCYGENSSGGELITSGAFGHTGFTGTSIWIDKTLGIYIILLTNRVHPSRDNTKIIRFRRVFHNSVISSLNKGE
ncbi:Esterase EstB [Clostridium liquoris]|jgi:CubicO group peptidase (beta-lactamase class C family)|uniref:Esterase EstB n=1 Tax=Clostridium liquoris TaxID=1289519 RepID=A0A2T0B6P9_9CLOT|nr:serine hydrolase domain-containing protein [Clostridium liquoris]PRR79542.1 Esterase EstB [Clostridium liquoris]